MAQANNRTAQIKEAIRAYRRFIAMMGLRGSKAGRADWVSARVEAA